MIDYDLRQSILQIEEWFPEISIPELHHQILHSPSKTLFRLQNCGEMQSRL